MAPESPVWEFRHSWTEVQPTAAMSDAPDGDSECSASCGSEMTSISRRILQQAAQQPTVKHSSYTQMYLGTSASLRATSAQRLKAALFTKVLAERKENQMQQETKKRRNHNVKLWLSDAENFPDLAGFLTVDEVPETPTGVAALMHSVLAEKSCNSPLQQIAPASPISCAVIYDNVDSAAVPKIEIPQAVEQRKRSSVGACAPKLEIPVPQKHTDAEQSSQATREAAPAAEELPDEFKEEHTAAAAQDAIFADGRLGGLEHGDEREGRPKAGCFPSFLRCMPSFRGSPRSKTPPGTSASGSVCDSDGLSAAKTSVEGGEEESTGKVARAPSLLRANLLSAASTPSQLRAPALWARGTEEEEQVEVEESNGQRRKVSAAIVHGPCSSLAPAPFLLDRPNHSNNFRSHPNTPGGERSGGGGVGWKGGAEGGREAREAREGSAGGAARVLRYA